MPCHSIVALRAGSRSFPPQFEHGIVPAGQHRSEWNGNDDGGTRAAAGVYLLRLVTESETRVKRLVLQR